MVIDSVFWPEFTAKKHDGANISEFRLRENLLFFQVLQYIRLKANFGQDQIGTTTRCTSMLPNERDTMLLGTGYLVTNATFKLKVVKCATESNNI